MVTATAKDVLSGKVIVGPDGNPITGTIPSVDGATITPNVSNIVAVPAGRYTTGAVIVKGDSNLKAANIKSGTSIFGVTGTLAEGYKFEYGTISGGATTTSVSARLNNITNPKYAFLFGAYSDSLALFADLTGGNNTKVIPISLSNGSES